MNVWRIVAPTLLLACAFQACGASNIQVHDPWVRATPPNARMAAGFLRLSNQGTQDDRLVELSSAAAGRIEIHRVQEVDGVMQMRHLAAGLPLPAGTEVTLAPGALHLMFIAIGQPFVEGGTVDVTLHFEHGAERLVTFAVRGAGETAD